VTLLVAALSARREKAAVSHRRSSKRCHVILCVRIGYIVSPLWMRTVIQEDRWKQADVESEAGTELVDDLPCRETSLMGIGTSPVEVELVKGSLGHDVGATLERFQIEELVFHEPVAWCGQERGARGRSRSPSPPSAWRRRSHLRTVRSVVWNSRAARLMPGVRA
jgi:hypothetical protein